MTLNTGQQLHKLKANDAGLNDQFGTSVDLDGNLAVVGAYLDDGGLGSAYLFDVSTGQQVTKLLPNDSLGRIQFGISVGIDNGVVIVGARGERPDGLFTGIAYLFDAATGTQLAQLYADDGSAFDNFGFAVAIDNDLALITAHEDNVHGSQSGSAYLFDVVTHQQLAKITAPDGGAEDLFGWSAAIDGSPLGRGVALVGARYGKAGAVRSGSAYLFDVSRIPEPTGIAMAWLGVVIACGFSVRLR